MNGHWLGYVKRMSGGIICNKCGEVWKVSIGLTDGNARWVNNDFEHLTSGEVNFEYCKISDDEYKFREMLK